MNTLSATSLETYIKCPKQYAYKYRDGLWPHRQSPAALQGQLFHDAMEYLVKASLLSHIPLYALNTRELLYAFFNQENIHAKIMAAGQDASDTAHVVSDLISAQLKIEAQWCEATLATPSTTELQHEFMLEGVTLPFKIRIDRVDKTPKGFWFIDYKTQSHPPSWSLIHSFEILQPWIYSLFGLQHYQQDFLGFVYFLPKASLIRPVMVFQDKALELASAWLPQKKHLLRPQTLRDKSQALIDFLNTTIEKIKSEHFSISPPPLTACRVCNYRVMCEELLNRHPERSEGSRRVTSGSFALRAQDDGRVNPDES